MTKFEKLGLFIFVTAILLAVHIYALTLPLGD
jgi:hypothetical protein